MSEHTEKLKIFEKNWQAALLLLPTAVFIAVFLYYPFLETVWLSLHRIRLLGTETWIGLDHYVTMFESSTYRDSFVVTLIFTAATVVLSVLFALLISFLIFEVDRYKNLYLVAVIWPYALPIAVAGVVLEFLIHPQLGVFTWALNNATGFTFDWQTDATYALIVVTFAAVWQSLGYSVIFITAALEQIPASLTEAARLDGVGRLRRLFLIYVPLISPILVFIVVIQTVATLFGGFALIDLMTGGGPDDATNILMFNLYQDAFQNQRFGYAAAQSVVLFVFVAIIMFVQLKLSDRFAHYGGV
jgi:sn-glycerol 3-phosphate transport system permease protein